MNEEMATIAREITEEQSLWQLWRKAHKIKVSSFNRFLFWLLFFAMVYFLYFAELDVKILPTILYNISEIGFTFATIMLGFSTAGFTVFSSFSNPDYLVDIAYHKHPDYNISYLKVIVCSFMNTFIVLLILLFLCFMVILLGGKDGLIENINIFNTFNLFNIIFLKSYFMILFSFFLFSMLLAKSLIFNIYKTIMISVRYNFEKYHT
jgi:hypothetical protein